MFDIKSVIACCDAAISAANKLEEAKKSLERNEAEYQTLVADKAALEKDVAALQIEKDEVQAEITDLNAQVFILRDLAVEKQEEEPTHPNNDSSVPSFQAPSSSSSSVASEVFDLSVSEGKDDDERNDGLQDCNSVASFRPSSQLVLSMASDRGRDVGTTIADPDPLRRTHLQRVAKDATIALQLAREQEGEMGQQGRTRQRLVCGEATSTTDGDHTPAKTAGQRTFARKNRIAKWYRSPKKWRRMIRTHRLQSIILEDF